MNNRASFDHLLDMLPAKPGSMFGYPALCIGRKPFAFFHIDTGQHVAFKLRINTIESYLEEAGFSRFDPSGGRPMKSWLQVPATHIELWPVLAKAAYEYLNLSLKA